MTLWQRWFSGSVIVAAMVSPLLASRLQETKPPVDSSPAKANEDAKPVKPQTGAELFVSSGCSHCHRIEGKGGVVGPDLSNIGRRWKDEQIRQRIQAGTLTMPSYGDVLSEPDLASLVTYLHKQRAKKKK